MEFGTKTRSEADSRQSMRLLRVQSDAPCFICHWNDEFFVGAESVPLSGLQMHADEQVVEAAPHWSRQVGVLYGVEELRLIHVAAQSVSNTVVSQRAH